MAGGTDPNNQGWQDYGAWGDNANFDNPWWTDPNDAQNYDPRLPGAVDPWNPVQPGGPGWGPDLGGGIDITAPRVGSGGFSYSGPGFGDVTYTGADGGLGMLPGGITIGDPSYRIGGDYPGAIGGYNDLINPPAITTTLPPEQPGHGSLGVDNPTVRPGGGIFGSGIDVGIPGIVSLGGLGADIGAGALIGGGLLGLGGGNIFGGGGSSAGPMGPPSTPDPSIPTAPAIWGTGAAGAATGGAQTPSSTTAPVGYDPAGGWGTPNNVVPPVVPGYDPNNGMDTPQLNTITPPVLPGYDPNNGMDTPKLSTITPPVVTNNDGRTGPAVDQNAPVTVPPIFTTPNTTPTPADTPRVGPTVVPPVVVHHPTGDPTGEHGPTTVTPVTPVAPVTPVTPVVPVPVTPVTPVTPVNPIPTPMPTPLDRNYYNEGAQTTQDFNRLGLGVYNNYNDFSGRYGNTDLNNYGSMLPGIGGYNQQLTGFANNQTVGSNTALRTGNVNDARDLGGIGLTTLQQLNPNMYSALNRANTSAGTAGQPSDIQRTLEDQARTGLGLGGNLSDEDLRRAQQSAREAWSARGLVNSPGAVGAEILNTDALSRQRLAERQGLAQTVDATGYAQRQGGFTNQLQNANLQSQNAFNPFQQITSANTQNQGNNQQLFGQAAGFSSGQLGNANVNQLVNPYNPYAQDVYNSNFNAGNARYIAAGNNAAAMSGARDASSGALANAFLNFAGSYYGSLPRTGTGGT